MKKTILGLLLSLHALAAAQMVSPIARSPMSPPNPMMAGPGFGYRPGFDGMNQGPLYPSFPQPRYSLMPQMQMFPSPMAPPQMMQGSMMPPMMTSMPMMGASPMMGYSQGLGGYGLNSGLGMGNLNTYTPMMGQTPTWPYMQNMNNMVSFPNPYPNPYMMNSMPLTSLVNGWTPGSGALSSTPSSLATTQDCPTCAGLRSSNLQPISFTQPQITPASESFTEGGVNLPARSSTTTTVTHTTYTAPASTSASAPRGDVAAVSDSAAGGWSGQSAYVERPAPVRRELPVRGVPVHRRGVGPIRREPLPPRELRRIRSNTRSEALAQRAPIWPSFIRNFNQCAPGCVPANYAAYGSRSHDSCHPTGQAIDVGAMICGGRVYYAIQRGRYAQMVQCMRGRMKALYFNGPSVTAGHQDHAHFSDGCYVHGRKVW